MAGLFFEGLAWKSDELDAVIATRSAAPLLITAPSVIVMSGVARDVHAASAFAASPFCELRPEELSASEEIFLAQWALLRRTYPAATLFIPSIERVPRAIQDVFAECMSPLAVAGASAPMRMISGTTIALFEDVAAGHFSATLFYRLNCIHLHVEESVHRSIRQPRVAVS